MNYSYSAIMSLKCRYKLTFKEALERYLNNKNKRKPKSQRLRRIWKEMISRCYNSKCKDYPLYGERGITVQDLWKDIYFNFEDDLYDSYIKHVEEFGEKDTTLDRIDVNGNYEPNNVRWATYKEQANNKRNNFIILDNMTVPQFSEKYNLSVSVVRHRLNRGWSVERIINTPVSKGSLKHVLPCNVALKHHCIANNYNYKLIVSYIKKYNLSPHEALARYLENKQKKKD